jgi:hypothetical protein
MGLVTSDDMKLKGAVTMENMVTLDKDLYEKLEDGREVLVGIAGDEVRSSDFDRASSSGASQLDTTGQAGVAVNVTIGQAGTVPTDLSGMNAKEAAKAVASMDAGALDQVEAAESDGKNRSTVLSAIDSRREELAESE